MRNRPDHSLRYGVGGSEGEVRRLRSSSPLVGEGTGRELGVPFAGGKGLAKCLSSHSGSGEKALPMAKAGRPTEREQRSPTETPGAVHE